MKNPLVISTLVSLGVLSAYAIGLHVGQFNASFSTPTIKVEKEEPKIFLPTPQCNPRCGTRCWFKAGEWAIARESSYARPLKINRIGGDSKENNGDFILRIDEQNGLIQYLVVNSKEYKHSLPR